MDTDVVVEEVVDGEKYWHSWQDSTFVYFMNDEGAVGIMGYLGQDAVITLPTTVTTDSGTYDLTMVGEKTFMDKDYITSVTVPEGYTQIHAYAFHLSDALTTVKLPKTLTAIDHAAFAGCPSLTAVNIPESVTLIGTYAFDGCASLTEIIIPDTVTMIGSRMFRGCTSLEKVVLPDTIKVIDEYAFEACTSLKEIVIPGGVTTIKNNAFFNCASLTSVTVPKSVINFGNNVFDGCSELKSLTLNAKITTLPAMQLDTMTSLEIFVMPETIKDIPNDYFRGLTTIKSITLPKKMDSIGAAAFYGCTSLEEVKLPEGIKAINAHTFGGCTSLKNINIPSTVTAIGESAFERSGLTSITIPKTVGAMYNGAFYNCTDLKEAIILTEDFTWLPDSTFDHCTSLESVTLPANLPKIGEFVFRDCDSLKEFTTPEGVTWVDTSAFEGCDSLTSITFSENVSFVGIGATNACKNLVNVKVLNPECDLGSYKALGDNPVTVIYGYADSSAQGYAEGYGLTFCDIEEMARREQVSAFAARMYTVVLNREADNKGMTDWTNWLLDHTVDGAGIAEGFFLSDEFVKKNVSNEEYVNILYRTFFDREADAAGRETWMGLLTEGKSRKSVLAGFVNSVEFDNLCTSYGIVRGTMVENEEGETTRTGVDGFVERLYSKVLKRNPDAEGMSTWKNLIVSGTMSAEEAAKSFFFSDEFIARGLSDADYVDTLYQTFMGRTADEAGKTMWVGLLADGMTRTEVLEGFSRSEEFKAILVSFGL